MGHDVVCCLKRCAAVDVERVERISFNQAKLRPLVKSNRDLQSFRRTKKLSMS